MSNRQTALQCWLVIALVSVILVGFSYAESVFNRRRQVRECGRFMGYAMKYPTWIATDYERMYCEDVGIILPPNSIDEFKMRIVPDDRADPESTFTCSIK